MRAPLKATSAGALSQLEAGSQPTYFIMPLEDINSSDFEDDNPPPPQARWAHAGLASLAVMESHALELRRSSKISHRNKSFYGGTPSEEYTRALWYNRFVGYRQKVLGVPPTAMPTCEHLNRFLYNIVEVLKPKGRDEKDVSTNPMSSPQVVKSNWALKQEVKVIQQSSLELGIVRLIQHCRFNHEDFKLKPTERDRLKSTMAKLLQDGLTTRKPIRDKMWITSDLIDSMATAMLKHAFLEGMAILRGLLCVPADHDSARDPLVGVRHPARLLPRLVGCMCIPCG